MAPTVSEKKDYYEVLGVARSADAGEIKRAYRKLAMELHPDRNPGNAASEAQFKEASEAYQVLSDPQKRAVYDRFGHAGPGGGFGQGFNDVGDIFSAFSDVFGDIFRGAGGPGAGRRGPGRGSDVETRLDITFAEAATGVTKDLKVRRRAPCATCQGSGAKPGSTPEVCLQCGGRGQVMHSQGFLMISTTCPICRGEGRVIRTPCTDCDGAGVTFQEETLQITIPAGVDDNATLRLLGRGEAGGRGGRSGNLYVVLHVEQDRRFERDGADLHTGVAVSFPQLALGDTVTVPTIDGEATLELPAGTQPGDTLRVRGKGMPHLEERGSGDIIAHVKLVVPKALSKEEEQHLRAFAEAGGLRLSPDRPSLFGRKKKK